MYGEQKQNYDPEIHDLIHDTPSPLPNHLYPRADNGIAINATTCN